MRKCKLCGVEFEERHGNQVYCGVDCVKAVRYGLSREEWDRRRLGWRRRCVVCGGEFVAVSHRQVYCGDECRERGNAALAEVYRRERRYAGYRHIYKRECEECGKEFESTFIYTKYCGRECREIGRLKTMRAVRQQRTCPVCGKEFAAFANQTYCCVACKKAHRNKVNRERFGQKAALRAQERARRKEERERLREERRLARAAQGANGGSNREERENAPRFYLCDNCGRQFKRKGTERYCKNCNPGAA